MAKVRVKMLVQMIGPDEERQIGDIVEVGEGEAARLIDVGFADPYGLPMDAKKRITRTSKAQKQSTRRGGSR